MEGLERNGRDAAADQKNDWRQCRPPYVLQLQRSASFITCILVLPIDTLVNR